MTDLIDDMPSGEIPAFSALAPFGLGCDATTSRADHGFRPRLSWGSGWTGAFASVQLEGETHVENEIAHAGELALLLAENSSDIVVRLTPTGVFEWVSGATLELLGWQPGDLLGRNQLTLRHPDDLAAGAYLLRPLLDGSVVTETDRILRADGSYRWMNRRYRAILDADGRAVYLIGSWRDASPRCTSVRRSR